MGNPVSYRINLQGNADDADMEKVRAAFGALVKALRKEGLTTNGVLTGSTNATRSADDVLVPAAAVHLDADQVDPPKEPAATRVTDGGPISRSVTPATPARPATPAVPAQPAVKGDATHTARAAIPAVPAHAAVPAVPASSSPPASAGPVRGSTVTDSTAAGRAATDRSLAAERGSTKPAASTTPTPRRR